MENKPDIIGTIEKEGFPLKRKGRNYWIACPFHEDKTPSLKIDPDRQNFFCFSCQTGGDSITFIQKLHGLSFNESLKYLNINGNRPGRTNPKEQTKRDLLKAFRTWESQYHGELADYYREFHNTLKGCQKMEGIEEFADDFHLMPIVENHMEILFNGTDEQKYALYQGVKANGNEGI